MWRIQAVGSGVEDSGGQAEQSLGELAVVASREPERWRRNVCRAHGCLVTFG